MRRSFLGVALGLIMVSAGTVAGCTPGNDQADQPTCRLVTPPSLAGPTAAGGVKVVEQGYTTVPPDRVQNSTNFPRVSIGAVLENTSNQVAYRTRVTFDAYDTAGRSVVSGPQVDYRTIEVPIMVPGAKLSVGNTVVADQRSTVAKVSVAPTVSGWLPPGDASNGLAPITAMTVNAGERKADGSAILSFTTRGQNCANLLSRGTTFAWRDATGKLVGGNTDGQTKQSACQTGGEAKPLTAMSQENTVPATADIAKTQVSALCDVARAPGVISSGQPIN